MFGFLFCKLGYWLYGGPTSIRAWTLPDGTLQVTYADATEFIEGYTKKPVIIDG